MGHFNENRARLLLGVKTVHYTQERKARPHIDAVRAGFPGREWSLDNGRLAPDSAGMVHVLGGLQFGALERLWEIRAAGLPYVHYDRAYFGGGPGSDRLRMVANGYHANRVRYPHGMEWAQTRDRLRLFVVNLSRRRESRPGDGVMVVPPSEAICSLFGLPSPDAWAAGVLMRLAACTDRPMWVSKKGDAEPLERRLARCHAVVTWTSNVAVEAILAGVPAFASEWSPAAPVAMPLAELEKHIERPELAPWSARVEWAGSLAWAQFTLDEIRSGFARSIVMQAFEGAAR